MKPLSAHSKGARSRSKTRPAKPPAAATDAGAPVRVSLPKTDRRYWEQRLAHSTYGSSLPGHTASELSARIEHEAASFCFPLGTSSRSKAATRALEIYQTVLTEGWPSALFRYPREFTMAVFWSEDPMIFTYTTLLHHCGQNKGQRTVIPAAPKRARVSQWPLLNRK